MEVGLLSTTGTVATLPTILLDAASWNTDVDCPGAQGRSRAESPEEAMGANEAGRLFLHTEQA